MSDEIEDLRKRVAKLEDDLESVWHMLSQLQEALTMEDFTLAASALSHPEPDILE